MSCSSPEPRSQEDLTSSARVPIAFDAPVPESFRLSSGLVVWHLRSEQVPLAALSLVIRAGSAHDPAGREGLAAITATMIDEGAGSRGPLEIAEAVDFLGASLSIETEKEHSQVSMEVLERNLDPALEILGDIILRPTFPEKEWDRVKALWLNDLIQRREEPREVARLAAERVFYGEGHPFAHPVDGYESSVRAIDLPAVREFHAARFLPEASILIFAGSISARDLAEKLERVLGGWKTAAAPPGPVAVGRLPAGDGSERRWVIVDKPRAPQTEIRVLVPAPEFAAPAAAPLSLANLAFGGTFTSRLMSNLRERQKFTYGATSGYSPRSSRGHLAAGSAVHAEKTLAAVTEFCREFRLMESGDLTEAELEKARSSYASRVMEALETRGGTIELYVAGAALGFPPDERREFYRRLARLPGKEASLAARETFRWDRATVVLVGDRELIEAELARSGARAELKDVAGRPLELPGIELRGREGELVRG